MSKKTCSSPFNILQRCIIVLGFLSGVFLGTNAQSFTLNVVDDNGNPVPDYKWTVQEDNTYDAVANVGIHNIYDTLSTSIHKSHAKILATGSGPTVNVPATGRYFVSVRGWGTVQVPDGYTLSGAMVGAGQSSVTVVLHANPITMAQVSILVFEDNAPINGAPDIPGERALSNFKIFIYDQFGQMTTDGFGNPIGTTYDVTTGATVTIGAGYVLTTTPETHDRQRLIPNLARANTGYARYRMTENPGSRPLPSKAHPGSIPGSWPGSRPILRRRASSAFTPSSALYCLLRIISLSVIARQINSGPCCPVKPQAR